jgi:hypothetical protein
MRTKDLASVVADAFAFLGEAEAELIAPESFKGGFRLRFAETDTEIQFLDLELKVVRSEQQLFGDQDYGSFSGNMFSPEHLADHVAQIAEDVKRKMTSGA